MKVTKGQYGYNAHLRKIAVCKTLVLFAISFSLFLAGYIATETRNNVLTVVAILGCLPASKSAVNMIMAFRAKGCSAGTAEAVQPFCKNLSLLYDLYMTSERKNFDISCIAVGGGFLYGYTEDGRTDTDAAEKHIQNILKLNDRPGIPVRILTDQSAFLERLRDMSEMPEGKDKDIEEIGQILKAVSL